MKVFSLKLRFMIKFLNACALLFLLSCQSAEAQKTYRVLFVGNSLTYVNSLPDLVREEAALRGVTLVSESLTFANYALEDHWLEGKVQRLISSEDFDFVVVQQGPSSQADGREMLLTYGEYLSDLCSKHGARLAFYMVWPSRSNFYMFDGVISNYSEAARATKTILCPVGEVWKAYMEETGDYSYYGADGFHPSLKGSKVAAKVIADRLLKE